MKRSRVEDNLIIREDEDVFKALKGWSTSKKDCHQLLAAFFLGGKGQQLAVGSAEAALHMSFLSLALCLVKPSPEATYYSWRFDVLKLRITHVLQPLILIGKDMEWSDQPDRCGGFNSRMFQKPSVISLSLSSSLVFLSQSHGFKGALVFLGCWSKAIESILRTSDRPSKNIDRVISSHLQSGVYSKVQKSKIRLEDMINDL
ncbi:hypothetical protein F2Q68_00038791 [Brassica cretica]|uniref:Uncharacterized protein n=1 Tax=Brassica cretica TaxID=69181 RepID=A0A8S9MIY2_BRACR|nr:hypothetical protein F2Q68_00038791 [Brassica cretica]